MWLLSSCLCYTCWGLVMKINAMTFTSCVVGFVCQGICLIIAGYTTNWLVAVVCLTLAVGGGGFAFSGFFINHLDIAPPFAGILMGLSNTVATLPGIISPLLTGVIVQHHVCIMKKKKKKAEHFQYRQRTKKTVCFFWNFKLGDLIGETSGQHHRELKWKHF